MKISSAFPSTYLKAADLQGKRIAVAIDHVTMEDIGDGHKPVVFFVGKDKGLVLNKTNANMIAEIAGTDETDEWTGHAIVLYPTKTDFQGKRVDAIRVDYPTKSKTKPNGATRRPVPIEESELDSDADPIPF